MSLKSIFCQDKVIDALQRAINAGKVPHAYIFAGPEGVGKFTAARELAKLLLCERPVVAAGFHDSCSCCDSCKALEADSHPDFKLIYKELYPFTEKNKGKKSGLDLPIDVIREFVVRKIASPPTLSKRTVFIIEEAQKLNNASQNALLKSLEEPPHFCTIILLATRLDKLLPTTQSRCQVLSFGPISEDIIIQKLCAEAVSETQARFWARFTQGSLGLSRLWSRLGTGSTTAYDIKRDLIDKLSRHTLADSVDMEEWIASQASLLAGAWEDIEKDTSKADLTRRALKGIILMIIAALNDAMKLGVGIRDLVHADQDAAVRAIVGRIDPESAAQRIADAYKSLDWVDASVNEKLILDDLLLNLA